VLFYTKSDKIWFHLVIALTHRSRGDGQLAGSELNWIEFIHILWIQAG
jgi:hypothetical protein